jgi:hypothetical protein
MFAIRGSHESGSDASAPRRSRTRLAALAAVAASCAVVPLVGAGSAQAVNGYFCGNGGSGTYTYLSTGGWCINPYYHTKFTALTANRAAGGPSNHCVGPSSAPGYIDMPHGYGCSNGGVTAAWDAGPNPGDGKPGYAGYWVASGSGGFYGWFNYI